MRDRSETWKQLVANGEFHLQTVALIYGATGNDPNATAGNGYKTYTAITAPEIKHGLLPDSDISIGNCIIGELRFTVMTTDNIPKSAKVVIKSRPVNEDGTVYGEWLEFGTYWVDHRTVEDDLITLECFDAMKMGNQVYSDDSPTLTWPKTIKTVLTRIAQQMQVSFDQRTVTYVLNSSYGALKIVTKPDDDEVLLDVMGHMAGIIGGNWIMTPENKLRFVPLIPLPEGTNYLLDNDYNVVSTDQGDDIVTELASGAAHPAGGGMVRVPVVVGVITTASTRTITKVSMSTDSEHAFIYGTDDGIELIVSNNPYATDSLCQDLYTRVYGIEYAPYQMTGCVYDPAAELGDWIVATDSTRTDKVRSVLYVESVKLDIGFIAEASAPGEDELENEYPYQSAIKRTQYKIANEVGKLYSTIQQTQSSILQMVSETYAQRAVFNTELVADYIYYLAYTQDYGVTTDTPGWSTMLQPINSTKKYLWVYRKFVYHDESVRKTTPEVICNFDDGGACIGVVNLYYASNMSTAPDLPTEEVHNAETDPLAWTINIPTLSDDYPYLYYAYEIHATETTWKFFERDTVTMTPINDFVRETRFEMTQYGAELESIEQNYVENTEVRSKFALDPTNITLSAGVDQHGNPTGVITFNSGTFVVNSDNFSVDANGHMECSGASMENEDSDGYWAKYEDAYIQYGYTSHDAKIEAASIKFGSNGYGSGLDIYSDDILRLKSKAYLMIESDLNVWLTVPGITIIQGSTTHDAFTGRINYVESISGSGGTINWTTNYVTVVNGLITTSA